MEDFEDLKLSSIKKSTQDDFNLPQTQAKGRGNQSQLEPICIEVKKDLRQLFDSYASNVEAPCELNLTRNMQKSNQQIIVPIKLLREERQYTLGKYGQVSQQISLKQSVPKKQNYSFNIIAALSQSEIVGFQVLEGTTDSVIFENFVYHCLFRIRLNNNSSAKTVVILMDNHIMHKHSTVLETIKRLNSNIIFNCEYSPWLNPIEQLFGFLKRKLAANPPALKEELVRALLAEVQRLDANNIQTLWTFSLKHWAETLRYGHI